MRDVELVDVEADARPARRERRTRRGTAPGTAPGTEPGRAAPRRGTRGARRRLVGGLLALGLAAGGLVHDRLAADRTAAAPAVTAPGMVAPVAAPPWERWRVAARRSDDVLAADGGLVVTGVRQGRLVVAAYDATSGETRWSRELGPVSGMRTVTGCPHGEGDVGAVLLCVLEPPTAAERTGGTAATPRDQRTARVLAIDASSGEEIGSWPAGAGSTDVRRVGDDLVLLGRGADGHLAVARRDGVTGAVRWRHHEPDPVRAEDSAGPAPELAANDAFVLVQGWSATVLAAGDGRRLTRAPSSWFVAGALSGEVFGTWSSADGGVVHDRHGRPLFRTRALFPAHAATDGTPGDVVVLDEGRSLVARALPDGEPLWRVETHRGVRLVVGERLVLVGADGYQVRDLGTGALTWESGYRTLMWWAPLTDGEVLLVPGRGPAGEPTVEGRRLTDGSLAWSVPLEPGARTVEAPGGHLVVRAQDQVVVLR